MELISKFEKLSKDIPLGVKLDWEEYFMVVAYLVSLRSTCASRRVGAIIVNGMGKGKRRIISTGYNGAPSGIKHCIEGGCPRFEARTNGLINSGEYKEDYYCIAYHAEHNALNQIMKTSNSAEGSVLFSTTFPCMACAKKISGSLIKTIYYYEGYPDESSANYLTDIGIEVKKVELGSYTEAIVNWCKKLPLGKRSDWDEYFGALSYIVSLKSKNTVQRDGSILVKDRRIIATGYNGDSVFEANSSENSVVYSSVENVFNQVRTDHITSDESRLYTTLSPTLDQAVEITGAGVKEVVLFGEIKLNSNVEKYLHHMQVELRYID